jgi:hypothetical protein
MKPGHGEVLIAEGDVALPEEEQRLIEEFRRQLDDVPKDAERVIFFPRAAGGI